MKAASRQIEADMTVNEVIALCPAAIPIFNEYGIDSCCGGGVALVVAVERDGVELSELLARLRACAEAE